jgi:hypothetical protein
MRDAREGLPLPPCSSAQKLVFIAHIVPTLVRGDGVC